MDAFVDPIKIQEIKVAVDVVCIAKVADKEYVLLIQRQYEPFKEHWALPGGFIKSDEEFIDGAVRELKEETNVDTDKNNLIEIGTYGKVGRDPRKRVISVAYLATFDHLPEVTVENETLAVEWKPLDTLSDVKLAFDHTQIIEDTLKVYRRA